MSSAYPPAETVVKTAKSFLDRSDKFWDAPLPENNGILQFKSDPSSRRWGIIEYLADTTEVEVFQLRALRETAEHIWPPNLGVEEDENNFRTNPHHCFFDHHDSSIPNNRLMRRQKVVPKDLDLTFYLNACEKINVSSSLFINARIGKSFLDMIKVFVSLMQESKKKNDEFVGF
jgi:hypothetical protein